MIYLDQLIKERNDYSSHLALIETRSLKHIHSGVDDRTVEIAQELRKQDLRAGSEDRQIAEIAMLGIALPSGVPNEGR